MSGPSNRFKLIPLIPGLPWIERYVDQSVERDFENYLTENVSTRSRTAFTVVSLLCVFMCTYGITFAERSATVSHYLIDNHAFWLLIGLIITSAVVLSKSSLSLFESVFMVQFLLLVALYGFWNSVTGTSELSQSNFVPMMTMTFCTYSLAIAPRAATSVVLGACYIVASLIWTLTVSSDVGTAFIVAGVVTYVVLVVLGLSGQFDSSFRIAFGRNRSVKENELLLEEQKGVTEKLLRNILPVTIVDRLSLGKAHLHNLYDRFPRASVLFADIKGFTTWSSSLDPARVGNILHRLMCLLDNHCYELKCEKVKTVGDAYWVVVGVPDVIPLEDMCYRISEFSLSMPLIMSKVNETYGTSLAQRIGVHCGPISAGIIGVSKFSYDVWGTTMDRCIDLEAGGVPNQVHVSAEFKQFLESTTNCKIMYKCVPSGLGTDEEPTFFLINDSVEEELQSPAPRVDEGLGKPNTNSVPIKPSGSKKGGAKAQGPSGGASFSWGDFVVEGQGDSEPKSVVAAVLKEDFAWGDFVVQKEPSAAPLPGVVVNGGRPGSAKPGSRPGSAAKQRTGSNNAPAGRNPATEVTSPSQQGLLPPPAERRRASSGVNPPANSIKPVASKTALRFRAATLARKDTKGGAAPIGSTDVKPIQPLEKKKENKYAAPDSFSFGDFTVPTSATTPASGKPTLTSTLAALSSFSTTTGGFQYDDFSVPPPKSPNTGSIEPVTSVDIASPSSTPSVSDDEEELIVEAVEEETVEDEEEEESKTKLRAAFHLIQESGLLHAQAWNMRFLHPLQEAMFQNSRQENSNLTNRIFGLCTSTATVLVFMLLWINFNTYDNNLTHRHGIALYVLAGVQLIWNIIGLNIGKEVVATGGSIPMVTAAYFLMTTTNASISATYMYILHAVYVLVLLPIVITSSRTHAIVGIILCLCVSGGELAVQLAFRNNRSDFYTFLNQVMSVVACCVVILRERLDRLVFKSVVTAQLEEINLAEEISARNVLLNNVLPPTIAKQLKTNSQAFIFDLKEECSVIFLDVLNFSEMCNSMEQEDEHDFEVCGALNRLFTAYDHMCTAHHVEKIKSIGSVYLAVVGAPEPQPNHAAILVGVAFQMMRVADVLLKPWPQLSVRIGIHSGPLVGGVLGTRKFAYDIFGDTVNTASRLMSSAGPRTIQISLHTHAYLPYSVLERYDWTKVSLNLKGKGTVPAFALTDLLKRSKEGRKTFREGGRDSK